LLNEKGFRLKEYSPEKAALYHLRSPKLSEVYGLATRATQGQARLRFAPVNNNALLFAPRIVFRFL
jgi:hypothetical protein